MAEFDIHKRGYRTADSLLLIQACDKPHLHCHGPASDPSPPATLPVSTDVKDVAGLANGRDAACWRWSDCACPTTWTEREANRRDIYETKIYLTLRPGHSAV